jgi:hypothetical protein
MGDTIEKSQELFSTMVLGKKESIGAESKLFNRNVLMIVLYSTDVALDYEAKITGIKRTRNISPA